MSLKLDRSNRSTNVRSLAAASCCLKTLIATKSPPWATLVPQVSLICLLPSWVGGQRGKPRSQKAERADDHAIERIFRNVNRFACGRASGGSSALLVGATRIVGELLDLSRAADRRGNHSVWLPCQCVSSAGAQAERNVA